MLQHPETGRTLFFRHELAAADTGVVRLATGFADLLVDLRVAFGRPMHVRSCCRTLDSNRRAGGHPRSLHLIANPRHHIDGAAAIDVRVGTVADQWELIQIAQELGWSFGLARWGVHLDRRDLAGLPYSAFGY